MSEYKDYRKLLEADDASLDCDEMIRLRRVMEIPQIVRDALEERIAEIADTVKRLERERDAIVDFLNGEVANEL